MNLEKMNTRAGLAAVMVLVLAACGELAAQEEAVAAPVVSAMTVMPARLDITEDLPGRVVAVRIAEIRPQVNGIILRRLFEQGSEVRAGQPLFQVNPAPFRAEVEIAAATLQRAEATLARARLQSARLQPLVKAEAISRQTYDDAVSQRDQAAADVVQARATLARRQLDLKFATVEAPIAGRIDQTLISEGALVSSTDSNPLARVQQIDKVYVDVRQPASSLDTLRDVLTTQQASRSGGVAVTLLRSDGQPYEEQGHILFSGMNVDAGTGDVLLRVLVDNPHRRLLPGMFVRARVPHISYPDALTIPQQAVVRSAGQSLVWVIDAKQHVRQVPVTLGELVDRGYRVRDGVQAGQRIVVEGLDRLSDGAEVNAQAWQGSAQTAAASAS